MPGRIPVTNVDHPLDEKIPFRPAMVNIYCDFVAFWIRPLGFLLRNFGRKSFPFVKEFIKSMGETYAFAAEVYSKNLSTTKRPFYIKNTRFLIIHSFDPHLMCIPSLHVMVVIRTYTLFREILKALKAEESFAAQKEELRAGAIAITEAVLYVKQHSVNCISAAMYAMTRFAPELFPKEEAEKFAYDLFNANTKANEKQKPGKEDSSEIQNYIISLYQQFLNQGDGNDEWTKPLLDFLKVSLSS